MKDKRVNFFIDEETYQRIRHRAFEEGITQGEYLRRAEKVYVRVQEAAARRGLSVDEYLQLLQQAVKAEEATSVSGKK